MPTEFPIGLRIYVYVLVFVFGACIASFVNCAADRYVAKKSIFGRSHCPTCGHVLGALDLIPIASYIFLRGKCRYCGDKIPARCLFTELLGGAGYLIIMLKFGISFEALQYMLLAPALLAISLIDTDTMEIPDGLILFVFAVFVLFLPTYADYNGRVRQGVIGCYALGGGLLILSLVMDAILKRESLGGGDIKLFGMVGLFTGPWVGLLTVILSCLFGLVMRFGYGKQRSEEFPFGPAICIAAFLALMVGNDVIDLYLSLIF